MNMKTREKWKRWIAPHRKSRTWNDRQDKWRKLRTAKKSRNGATCFVKTGIKQVTKNVNTHASVCLLTMYYDGRQCEQFMILYRANDDKTRLLMR